MAEGRDIELVVAPDAEAAAQLVAERLAEAARKGGHVVLTGGTTPKRAYELTPDLEGDWSRVELWWGDERCSPPDDQRSNYHMARVALIERLSSAPASGPSSPRIRCTAAGAPERRSMSATRAMW